MDEKTVERKRMNHYVSADVAKMFELFFEMQHPPLSKQVLYEITLTRGMHFDGDHIMELKVALTEAWDLLAHRDSYMTTHWDKMAKKSADRLLNIYNEMEHVK